MNKKTFKPMLASNLDEAKIEKHLETRPLLITPKIDGIRVVTAEDGTALGRSLKPIPNKHVQAQFKTKNLYGYDGEIVVGSPSSPTVYRDTFSGVMSIEGTPDFTYWVFDHFGHSDASYIHRLENLQTCGFVRVLPQKVCKTMQDVLDYENIFLEQGFEGAMLRRLNAPYKYGRATTSSLDLMKVKREVDDESLILDIYPAYENQNEAFINELGHTERTSHQENLVAKDMAGGFVLTRGSETFKCSMGKFDHNEREWIWRNRANLIGKAYVKYRSFPHGEKDKPRFPRALGFRDSIDMG